MGFKGFGVYRPSGIFENAGFIAAFYDFGSYLLAELRVVLVAGVACCGELQALWLKVEARAL